MGPHGYKTRMIADGGITVHVSRRTGRHRLPGAALAAGFLLLVLGTAVMRAFLGPEPGTSLPSPGELSTKAIDDTGVPEVPIVAGDAVPTTAFPSTVDAGADFRRTLATIDKALFTRVTVRGLGALQYEFGGNVAAGGDGLSTETFPAPWSAAANVTSRTCERSIDTMPSRALGMHHLAANKTAVEPLPAAPKLDRGRDVGPEYWLALVVGVVVGALSGAAAVWLLVAWRASATGASTERRTTSRAVATEDDPMEPYTPFRLSMSDLPVALADGRGAVEEQNTQRPDVEARSDKLTTTPRHRRVSPRSSHASGNETTAADEDTPPPAAVASHGSYAEYGAHDAGVDSEGAGLLDLDQVMAMLPALRRHLELETRDQGTSPELEVTASKSIATDVCEVADRATATERLDDDGPREGLGLATRVRRLVKAAARTMALVVILLLVPLQLERGLRLAQGTLHGVQHALDQAAGHEHYLGDRERDFATLIDKMAASYSRVVLRPPEPPLSPPGEGETTSAGHANAPIVSMLDALAAPLKPQPGLLRSVWRAVAVNTILNRTGQFLAPVNGLLHAFRGRKPDVDSKRTADHTSSMAVDTSPGYGSAVVLEVWDSDQRATATNDAHALPAPGDEDEDASTRGRRALAVGSP